MSCGDEKWDDWRPHLAMILSNTSAKSASGLADLDKKSIIAMGNALLGRGLLLAAHFCFLVAQVEFGSYSKKSSSCRFNCNVYFGFGLSQSETVGLLQP